MITHLHLRNFRKHTNLQVTFTAGLNVIRGHVEAGKSTIFEGIAYCLFGAVKGMQSKLSEVVSYGQPESALKATCQLNIAGVVYEISRSKAGATISWLGQTVTGQDEVTRFVEKLLGVPAKLVGSLMLAKQSELSRVLSDGSTKANQMVTDLADLQVIDGWVKAIQDNLPSGNLGMLKSSVESLSATLTSPLEVIDTAPLMAEVVRLTGVVADNQIDLEAAFSKLRQLDKAAAEALVAKDREVGTELFNKSTEMAKLEASAALTLEPLVPEADLAALREKVRQQEGLGKALALHAKLKAADLRHEPQSAEDVDRRAAACSELLAHAKEARRAAAKAKEVRTAQMTDLRSGLTAKLASAKAKVITESTCAFCKKDLTDVPEVLAFNVAADAAVIEAQANLNTFDAEELAGAEAVEAQLRAADCAVSNCEKTVQAWQDLIASAAKAEALFAACGEWITLDRSYTPAKWVWVGPTDEPQDLANDLITLERKARSAQAAHTLREADNEKLITLRGHVADLHRQIQEQAFALSEAVKTLLSVKLYEDRLTDLKAKKGELDLALFKARTAATSAEQLNKVNADHRAQNEAALAKAEENLKEAAANNALVGKLRDIRPKLADHVWTLVLVAVSQYFSDMRGEQSVVTCKDGEFMCNGQAIDGLGLSGSAKDLLGLALRIATVKTFLPAVSFLFADEPASACNIERETRMLGTLATCGFEQVIIVTHSDIADAFGDNVIHLEN